MIDRYGQHEMYKLPAGSRVVRGFLRESWTVVVQGNFLRSYPVNGINFWAYVFDPEVLFVSMIIN